jgi:hypothetical protein
MKYSKKQGCFLNDTKSNWEKNGVLTKETADILRNSYSIQPFDYKKLAKYAFWIAIICAITF